ncbi:hypothetical protein CP8484711_0487A, partial [Chlamydia psittaci 84-8471/1]
MENKRK